MRSVDVYEVERRNHTGDGPVDGGARGKLNGLYGGRFSRGERNEGVTDLKGAGFEMARHTEGILAGAAENVVDGEAERAVEVAGPGLRGVEGGEECRAGVPGGV